MTSFRRPYSLYASGYYYVVRDADGYLVAQGSGEMCAQVVAGKISTITPQGDMFHGQDISE